MNTCDGCHLEQLVADMTWVANAANGKSYLEINVRDGKCHRWQITQMAKMSQMADVTDEIKHR